MIIYGDHPWSSYCHERGNVTYCYFAQAALSVPKKTRRSTILQRRVFLVVLRLLNKLGELANCTRGVKKVEVQCSILKPSTSKLHERGQESWSSRLHSHAVNWQIAREGLRELRFKAPFSSHQLANCTRGLDKVEVQGSMFMPWTSKLHERG